MSGGVDIATLGLEIRSDGVVVASNRLRDFQRQAGQTEKAVDGVKGAANSAISTLRKMATALGAAFAVNKMREYLIHITRIAGQYDMMGIAMHTAGRNAGYSAAQMDVFEEALKKSGIAAIEARKAMTRLAASGVELEKSSQIARAAQDLAVVGGINSSEAFERLSAAITKGQSELLDGIGIAKNFQQGYEETAKAIGRTVESLSENEKMQSRVNMVLEEAAKFQGIYEKSMTSAEKQNLSLTRHIQTYEIAFGKAFQPAYLQYVKAQTENYKNMTAAVSDPRFQQSLTDVSVKFADLYQTLATKAMDSLPGLLESVGNGLDKIPGALDSISVKIKGIYEFYQALPDELIGAAGYGILGRMLFGSWKVGLFLGAVSEIYGYIQKASGEVSGRQLEIDKLQSILNSQKTTTASDPIGDATRQRIAELKQEIQDIKEFGRVINEPFERLGLMAASSAKEVGKIGPKIPVGLFTLLGDETDIAAFAMEGLSRGTTGLTEAQKAATTAAENHAKKIADVIANLKWELSIVNLAEGEQAALNAVRSAGVDVMSKQGQEIYKLTKALQEERDMIAFNREELDRMAQDMAASDYEGVEANFQWDEKVLADAKKQADDAAAKAQEAWTEAAKNIQNAWAGLFSKIFRGEIADSSNVLKELMYTLSDNAAQNFAAQFQNMDWGEALSGMDKDVGKFFTDILDDFGLTAGKAVNSLAAVIATAYSAVGMAKKDAALSGAITGAQVGGQSGNGYAAAAGLIIGGAAGYMLGSNGPSTGERLADAIDKLIETLQENTTMLADQILKTDELTLAQDAMARSIFSTKLDGMEATLAGAFKIPEGTRERGNDTFDNITGGVISAVGTVFSLQTRGLSMQVANAVNAALRTKDKGYTSYDYDRQETSGIISVLIEKMGVPDFITLMAETAKDGGALIEKLVETGYILADMPERILKHYSDGGSSKLARNEKVAEAIFNVLVDGIMETAAAIDQMNVASDAFAKTWRDKDLTSKDLDMQSWEETMNVFGGEAMQDYLAQVSATRDALLDTSSEALEKMDASELEDHFKNIAALDKVLTDSTDKLAEAEETRLIIEQHYYDALVETTAAMNKDIAVATGMWSTMQQTFMSIRDAGEKYIEELVDEGKNKTIAIAMGEDYIKTLQKEAFQKQFNADQFSIESAILQERINLLTTLGKTEEAQILNQQMINKNRQIEVQGLIDTYGYGTDAFNALFDFRKELWEVQDASRNAAIQAGKAAEAIQGMWTSDSIKDVTADLMNLREIMGEAFAPRQFLKSIGLEGNDNLIDLLFSDSFEDAKADWAQLVVLWRTGVITQDQYNSILGKINENASTLADNIEKAAQAEEERWRSMNAVGKASNEWYRGHLTPELEGIAGEFKQVEDDLEQFRRDIVEAGSSVANGWEKGGYIENAVKDAIRKNFLADMDTEISEALSGLTQSDYMQSISKAGQTYSDRSSSYIAATKQMSDAELNAAISAIQSRAVAKIEAAGASIGSLTTWLEKYKEYYEANGDPQGFYAKETARLNAMIVKYNDKIAIINDNADAEIEALKSIVFSSEKLAEIQTAYALEIQAINKGVLDSVRGTMFDITGDTDILLQQLIDLQSDFAKTSSTDYGGQVDILQKQYSILIQLRDIQKQTLEETISNYNALQDVILELQGGSLAPVQSKEFFELRYAQLLADAQSGDTDAINALTNFVNQYADFMGAYGDVNYKDFTASIINDLKTLQDKITDGASISDLKDQLEDINNSLMSPLSIDGMDTIVSRLDAIAQALKAEIENPTITQAYQTLFDRLPDAEGLAFWTTQWEAGILNLSNLNRFLLDAAAPDDLSKAHELGFFAYGGRHRGGLRIVGERGPELEYTGPSTVHSNRDSVNIIAEAVSSAMKKHRGGDTIVKVYVGNKELKDITIDTIQNNTEAHHQIRRVANGR